MNDWPALVAELKALAMDFEGEALHESTPRRYRDLREAAAQIRFTAVLISEGTYTYATGLAWLDAGRITLNRYRKAVSA